MKIVFIADFFIEDLTGGAEFNDNVLITELQNKGVEVEKIRCSKLSENDVLSNDVFIVSNFSTLSDRLKNMIMLKKYIIYEHDHKYVSNRDPSKFTNYKIPEDEIINREFYRKAHRVVVLSKICKEIMQKTLEIDNIDSIGCSLWSDEQLNYIESIHSTNKTKENFVINSSNPIKGTKQAVDFCKKSNIDYELIGPSSNKALLKEMSEFKGFVFAPQVLETMSRVVVESKMLGCKVFTSKTLIGACYEDWYSLDGIELINTMRQKKSDAIDLFYNLLQDESITVILNCYRRPENLREQIESIRKQTVKIEEIWVWVNYHEDNCEVDFSQFDCDKVIRNDFNWKFYGRFAGALLSNSKYIAMFDDDTIPGSKWLENCLNTMKTSEGILGGAGVILDGSKYTGHERHGWSSQNEDIIEVDLVGHAWFFKREWLRYLWMEKPFTWDNGEDIQFSYCCQKYGNIKTYCPPHPKSNLDMFSSLKGYELGVDSKATSSSRNHSVFYAQRDACVKNAIMNGWKIINSTKTTKFNFENKEISITHPNPDHQDKYWSSGLFYELKLLKKIKSFNLKGCYVDIGANLGNHSIFFSMFTGCEKLVCFEPHPQIYPLLVKNLSRLNLNNVDIHNFAISDKEEELLMSEVVLGNCGSSRIENNGSTPVSCNTLDSFGLKNVSLIKIDTEGYEINVVKGAENTLKKHRPVIIAELASREQFEEFKSFVEPLGYSTDGKNYAYTPTYIWRCL